MARQPRRQPTPSSNVHHLHDNSSAPDPDENKRAANRLAQRKFRRQRKDYIAHLERELALCREGATGELVRRRHDIARLNQEKAKLRELLETVATTLARVCGVDISVAPSTSATTSQPPGAFVEPATPQIITSHCHDHLQSPSTTAAEHDQIPDSETTDLQDTHDTVQAHGQVIPDIGPDADSSAISRQSDCPAAVSAERDSLRTSKTAQEEAGHEWLAIQDAADSLLHWTGGAYRTRETATEAAPAETWGNHIQMNQSILLSQSIPPTVCPSCCTGRHNGSNKTQMMAIMLRHRVEELVDSSICLYQGRAQTQGQIQLVQTLETTLVDGLIETIISLQTLCFTLLGIRTVCLIGGSAWILWQTAKTSWILPRLADAGILARVADVGYNSDIFRDTMPDWLRPTEIQKTFEHHPAIDHIPWVPLREALVLHQDNVDIDDIFVNLLSREMPTGADMDRPLDPTTTPILSSLRAQFQSSQERLLRDNFYSSHSMFHLAKSCKPAHSNCTSLLVDSMMAGQVPFRLE